MLLSLPDLIKKYVMNIKGVIHVGAHTFEEKPFYDALNVKCYWIEANPELCNGFTETDMHKLYNFAAANYVGLSKFYVTNNIASSSLLKLKDHITHHPKVKHLKTIDVIVNKIDNIGIGDANFMNLDIQGAELLALKGAKQTLKNINYIYTEVNRAELYEGCCLITDIDRFLIKDFKRVETYWTSHNWGDALYIRR